MFKSLHEVNGVWYGEQSVVVLREGNVDEARPRHLVPIRVLCMAERVMRKNRERRWKKRNHKVVKGIRKYWNV